MEDSQKLLKGQLEKSQENTLVLHPPSTFQELLLGLSTVTFLDTELVFRKYFIKNWAIWLKIHISKTFERLSNMKLADSYLFLNDYPFYE